MNGNWRRRGTCALVLVLFVAMAACGTEDGAPAGGEGLPDEIRLGVTLPQTGAFSPFGRFYEDAFRLWVKDVNEGGGLLGSQVDLTILDDQSDASTATSLYTRLITVDNVDLIIGGFPTPVLVPVLEIAERNQMVMVQGGHNAAPLIRAQDYEYVFTTITGSDLYAQSFMDWLSSIPAEERPETVAFVEQVNPFLQDVVATVRPQMEDLGIRVTGVETFSDDAQDFTSIVQRLQNDNVEFVWVSNNVPAAVSFMRTAAEQNYQPRMIYVTAGPTLPTWVDDLGATTNAVFSSTPYWHSVDTPGNADFVGRIQEEYGYVATRESGMAYTVLQVLQQAIEATESIDQEALRDYLAANEFQTVTGRLSFDDDGLTELGAYVMQVQGDDRMLVWPQSVREADPINPRP